MKYNCQCFSVLILMFVFFVSGYGQNVKREFFLLSKEVQHEYPDSKTFLRLKLSGTSKCVTMTIWSYREVLYRIDTIYITDTVTHIVENIPVGRYYMELSDGCQRISGGFDINRCNKVEITSLKITHPQPGRKNGWMEINANIPEEAYYITLDNEAIYRSEFSGFWPGRHVISVVDSLGCRADSVFIAEDCNIPFEPILFIVPPSDAESMDGFFIFLGNSYKVGIAPFSYTYSNLYNEDSKVNAMSYENHNLRTGMYSFTVTDSKGCQGNWETYISSHAEYYYED